MDPTRTSNYGPGDLRRICELNKESDLSRIIDIGSKFELRGKNEVQFPKKAYVINLTRRHDRWERFNSLNKQLFSNFEVERFDAVEDLSDVPWAIFRSYLDVMEKAFGEDCQDSIVVMEDDAYLVSGAMDKIRDSYASLPQDWDILIGNHYFFGEMGVINEHLAKPLNRASTINFSIIRNTILDKIKDNLNMREGDKLDIDHFITSCDVPINNYSIWPMVSREYLSHSDHKGCEKNMEMRIREHAYLFPFVDGDKYYPSLAGW
jgi:GR25 family glycosyltransferase involved in LPS biosynthesis